MLQVDTRGLWERRLVKRVLYTRTFFIPKVYTWHVRLLGDIRMGVRDTLSSTVFPEVGFFPGSFLGGIMKTDMCDL